MTDPRAVTLADLPDGWSCMSLDGYALGGTPEALDEVKRVLTEVSELKRKHYWAEDDQQELIGALGVRPIHWNGVWQAFLNETNVPVKAFKQDEQACLEWCEKVNNTATDTPTHTIEQLTAEVSALRESLLLVAESDNEDGSYQYTVKALADHAKGALMEPVSGSPTPETVNERCEQTGHVAGMNGICIFCDRPSAADSSHGQPNELLRRAEEWIRREVEASEVELPDAEELLRDMAAADSRRGCSTHDDPDCGICIEGSNHP